MVANLTLTDFTNTIDTIQSTVRSLIFNDATVGANAIAILDGSPSKITEETGRAYVLVHTPTFNDIRITGGYTPKYKSEIELLIEIVGKMEGTCRTLCDAVRYAINHNQANTRAIGAFRQQLGRTRMSRGVVPTQTGNATVYTFSFPLRFDWYGRTA